RRARRRAAVDRPATGTLGHRSALRDDRDRDGPSEAVRECDPDRSPGDEWLRADRQPPARARSRGRPARQRSAAPCTRQHALSDRSWSLDLRMRKWTEPTANASPRATSTTLSKPFVEPDLPELCVVLGNKCALAQLHAVVPRLRVTDD